MSSQDLLQLVSAAILTLQYNPDPQAKREADTFLQKFQTTPGAWQIAHVLLLNSSDLAVQFVAANILYYKTKYDWRGMNAELRNQFIDSFFNLIKVKSVDPSAQIVFKRICLTLSAAIARSSADLLTRVLDSIFLDSHSPSGSSTLLEILTTLVDEVNSSVMTLKDLGENKRAMSKFVERIVILVRNNILQFEREQSSDSKKLLERSLIAFSHWIKFGVPLSMIGDSSQGKSLLEYVFDFINPNGPYIPSIEILLQLFTKPAKFEKATSLRFDQGKEGGERFFEYLMDRFVKLRSMWITMKEDEEFTKGLVQLGIGLAEANLPFLLHSNENLEVKLKFLGFLVELTANSNDKATEMCINFWSVAEESARILSNSQKQVFYPVFSELIQVLLKRIEWREEFDDEEEEESLYSLRTHARGFFSGVIQFFGIEHFVHTLSVNLQQTRENQYWKEGESILLVVGCISATVNVDDLLSPSVSQNLSEILLFIFQYPNHPRFHVAASLLIGNLGGWFNKNSPLLGKSISYLIQLFHSDLEELRSSSVESFKSLCEICGELMANDLQSLIQAAERAFPVFGINDRAALMEGLVNVVVYLSPDLVAPAMFRIIGPVLSRIDNLVRLGTREASISVRPELSLLAKAFELPDNDQEIQTVDVPLEMILPILNSLLSLWHSDAEVMKLLCDLYKITISGVDRKQFLGNNHLVDILNNVSKLFSAYHHDFCLDLIQSGIETGVHTGKESELVVIFENVSTTTFTLMNADRSNVSLLRSFFSLCSGMTKKNPVVIRSSSISTAVQLAIACLSINERESLRSIISFLEELLTETKSPEFVPLVNSLLEQHGEVLVKTFVGTLASGLMVQPLIQSKLLFSLLVMHHQTIGKWMTEVVSGLDLPLLNEDGKRDFLQVVLQAREFRRFRAMINDFSNVANGKMTADIFLSYQLR